MHQIQYPYKLSEFEYYNKTMGIKISIDKHVSNLDDILEMSPHYLSKV